MPSHKERAFRIKAKRLETRINEVRLKFSDVRLVASELLEDLDTPTSLGLWLCLKYGDLKSVIAHDIRAIDFRESDIDEFRRSYQAVSFLRKMAYKINGLDPDATALAAFHEGEAACRLANQSFRKYRSDPLLADPRIHIVLHYMMRDISATLGGFSPDTWMLASAFGPGAAVGAPGSLAYDKMGAKPCVTDGFAFLGAALVNSSPAWRGAVFNESSDFDGSVKEPRLVGPGDMVKAPGGRYCQVPKSAKTNRNIEVQPNLNAYAQLGLGRMIRTRLRLAGLPLSRQADQNKRAAMRGSKDGSLATIDLSAASDTICRELVEELIPLRWLHAMRLCRTSHISMPDGSIHRLERWSSMGNGYTFELETLIFWSLVRACRRLLNDTNEYHIFGDDIICSTRVAKLVMEMLPLLGFKLNKEKTFVDSLFRESCGGDYFNGVNVRPYFYKKGDDNANLQAIVSLANGLRRAAWRSNNHYGCDCRFRRAWVRCLNGIPRDIRQLLIGPWSDHDLWIISDTDDWMRNPEIFRDRATWSWRVPSLSSSKDSRTPSSFSQAKAAMLYDLEKSSLTWQGDELSFSLDRAARESSLFSLPNTYGERQRLDVTHVELSPALHLWV